MRKAIQLTVFIFLWCMTISFAQIFQGPANGSVSSGVVVNTNSFTDGLKQGRTFNPKPMKNIFTQGFLPNPSFDTAPLGGEGSNYTIDPTISNQQYEVSSGDFVLSNNFVGVPDQGYYIPPDPILAVGPTHIIAMVNSRFRIMTKAGVVEKTIEASSWYSSTLSGADPFDPKVIYDQFSKRWVMVWLHLGSSTGYFLVSVSDDSIPTGVWHNYAFNSSLNGTTNAGNWGDYQGVGYDENAIYITSNQFTFSSAWNYVKLRIINKSELYASTPGVVNYKDLWDIKTSGGVGIFGLRPSRTMSPSSTYYLACRSPYVTGNYFLLYKLTSPLTSPSLTVVEVPVAAYTDPPDAGQLGGTQTIDGGASHLRNEPVFKNGILHLIHSVKSGTGGAYSSVRYASLNVSTNTAVDDKAMGADTYFHTYPALAVDPDNNIVLTYSRSASTEYMGAYYTSLPAGGTALTGSKLLKVGAGYYYKTFGGSRNRWGDYNGAWTDPSSGKIYILTEYVAATNTWGSWIGELTFSSTAQSVTVVSPDGGENWAINSNKNITWSTSNITNVKIEYSTNNGTSWIQIAASVAAGSGSYAWTVPNTPSTQCKVRVSDASNASMNDLSNGTFTISSGGAQYNWVQVPSGTTGDLWGVDIVSQSVMWVCANNGDVKRTTDGGQNWVAAGNAGEGAYSIAALDAQTAIVSLGPSAGDGKIMRTTNGGTNWTQVYTAAGVWFNFVDNISSTLLWAQSDPTGGLFHIVKSTDGGATWALTANRPTQPATNVFGANGSFYRIGNVLWFGCGSSGTATTANRVYKSVSGPDGPWDFGTTTLQNSGTIAFSSVNGAGLAGFWNNTTTINRSTNGGVNWTAQATSMESVQGLEYVQGTSWAWAATSNGLFKTSNDGATWVADLLPAGAFNMNAVRFLGDANVGIAVGGGGALLMSQHPSVIPVEFSSFTATQSQGKVILNWETATETNNRGFEVERKVIKGDNDAHFITVGFKNGFGTTTSPKSYTFSDDVSSLGAEKVVYRLRQIDFDGRSSYSDEVLVDNLLPTSFNLEQNFPNPFNPVTNIKYTLPENGIVTLSIYNLLGEKIVELVNEMQTAGEYSVEFNAEKFASGNYVYRLNFNGNTITKKMTILK